MTKEEAFARKAHEGQKRYDGSPYINHPEAVARMVSRFAPKFVATAWLHDVLEDCPYITAGDLLSAGFEPEVVKAVEVLTKMEGWTYGQYIERVCENHIARTVKTFDILHNLSDQPTQNQVARYAKALICIMTYPTPIE